jgi:Zinc knuckle
MARKNERYAEGGTARLNPARPVASDAHDAARSAVEGSDEADRIASVLDQAAGAFSGAAAHTFGGGGGRGFAGGGGGGRAFSAGGGGGGFSVDRPPRPGPNYLCHRCKTPGHWIDQCPTNGDLTFDRVKVRAPTGIPRSMLKTVDAPESGTGLKDSSGQFVALQPNEAEFARQTVGLRMSKAAAAAAAAGTNPNVHAVQASTASPRQPQQTSYQSSSLSPTPQPQPTGSPNSDAVDGLAQAKITPTQQQHPPLQASQKEQQQQPQRQLQPQHPHPQKQPRQQQPLQQQLQHQQQSRVMHGTAPLSNAYGVNVQQSPLSTAQAQAMGMGIGIPPPFPPGFPPPGMFPPGAMIPPAMMMMQMGMPMMPPPGMFPPGMMFPHGAMPPPPPGLPSRSDAPPARDPSMDPVSIQKQQASYQQYVTSLQQKFEQNNGQKKLSSDPPVTVLELPDDNGSGAPSAATDTPADIRLPGCPRLESESRSVHGDDLKRSSADGETTGSGAERPQTRRKESGPEGRATTGRKRFGPAGNDDSSRHATPCDAVASAPPPRAMTETEELVETSVGNTKSNGEKCDQADAAQRLEKHEDAETPSQGWRRRSPYRSSEAIQSSASRTKTANPALASSRDHALPVGRDVDGSRRTARNDRSDEGSRRRNYESRENARSHSGYGSGSGSRIGGDKPRGALEGGRSYRDEREKRVECHVATDVRRTDRCREADRSRYDRSVDGVEHGDGARSHPPMPLASRHSDSRRDDRRDYDRRDYDRRDYELTRHDGAPDQRRSSRHRSPPRIYNDRNVDIRVRDSAWERIRDVDRDRVRDQNITGEHYRDAAGTRERSMDVDDEGGRHYKRSRDADEGSRSGRGHDKRPRFSDPDTRRPSVEQATTVIRGDHIQGVDNDRHVSTGNGVAPRDGIGGLDRGSRDSSVRGGRGDYCGGNGGNINGGRGSIGGERTSVLSRLGGRRSVLDRLGRPEH